MIIDIRLALMLIQLLATMVTSESMEEPMIDLKSKLYLIDSDPYLFNSSIVDDSSVLVSRSHLHSNQLNGSMVSQFFRLVNKTSVMLNANETALTRERICSSLKYCHRQVAATATSNLCVLNLNLIVYLSSTSNNQLNQIKLIDIDLVVNDLTGDYLYFERRLYEFDVYVSKHDTAQALTVGSVRALNGKNSDLIRYFLNLKDRKDDLFAVETTTGEITLNRTKFNPSHSRKFKFAIDAQVQCAPGQRAMYNQTHVTVNVRLDDSWVEENNQNQVTFNVTNFVPVRKLTLTTGHCLVLDQADLTTGAVNSIAVAQVQIENFDPDVDYGNLLDLNELNLAIDSIRPPLTQFKLELKHLVDNIYIVYVVKSHDRIEHLYLNDLYQVTLRFVHENIVRLRDIYLCVNTGPLPLVDKLNLVQFESSLINFKPVDVRPSIDIVLHKLTSSNVTYFIDDVVDPNRFKIGTNYFYYCCNRFLAKISIHLLN